jgi:hypothetical protein
MEMAQVAFMAVAWSCTLLVWQLWLEQTLSQIIMLMGFSLTQMATSSFMIAMRMAMAAAGYSLNPTETLRSHAGYCQIIQAMRSKPIWLAHSH